MLHTSELKIGDRVEIQIIGTVGKYNAEVIGFDTCSSPCPLLKVEGWPMTLKHQDHIINKKIE